MKKSSYSAADVNIPIKLLHDVELVKKATGYKQIMLRHLQLSITNKCTLQCCYCSCNDVDKNLELELKRIRIILEQASEVGCRAITITGGGEPLLHPEINEVIRICHQLNISVGLVTNGTVLERLEEKIEWCRISFDSDRSFDTKFTDKLEEVAYRFSTTDWAFSFVAFDNNRKNGEMSLGDLKEVIEFANLWSFTHVRVVSDIFNPDDRIIKKARLILEGIDELVFYQSRTKPTRGSKKCLISLLKPVIGTDGNMYPCCGVQYAIKNTTNDFVKEMSMGKGEKLKDINILQKYFNGSVCDVCYYQGYNNLLSLLIENVEHKEWV